MKDKRRWKAKKEKGNEKERRAWKKL